MAPASSTGTLVDLEALDKEIGTAERPFDLSVLIGQVLIGIAGYSQASAERLKDIGIHSEHLKSIGDESHALAWHLGRVAGASEYLREKSEEWAHRLAEIAAHSESLRGIAEIARRGDRENPVHAVVEHPVRIELHKDTCDAIVAFLSDFRVSPGKQPDIEDLKALYQDLDARHRDLKADHEVLRQRIAETLPEMMLREQVVALVAAESSERFAELKRNYDALVVRVEALERFCRPGADHGPSETATQHAGGRRSPRSRAR
jgi:hypothetical protein